MNSSYDDLLPAAARVHELLLARGETVATAESLTGGLVVAALTAVAGASATVRGGLIVYAVELKTGLAGVPAELIERYGVVSTEVAGTLAAGARERCGATWGLGLTGVAGPEPHGGRAPGTVCFAVAGPAGVQSRTLVAPGDRHAVRTAAGLAVLVLCTEALSGSGKAGAPGSVSA